MRDNIIILGDWISDVYINTKNIQQNQEIVGKESIKGYYDEVNVYPGGTGFLIDNLLKLVEDNNKYRINYLLPDFNFINYVDDNFYAFNIYELFDRSIKYIYNNRNCENFNIIKMQPIDYIRDNIQPTVKVRFFSKKRKEVFYRFDMDNNIQLRNINCSQIFTTPYKTNNLILIDYDKGYFNKHSTKSLSDYIETGVNISTLFLNTKPHKIELYKDIIHNLRNNYDCKTIIQLNESEFEPIKDELLADYDWEYIIVTRGTKSIQLYIKIENDRNTWTMLDISIGYSLVNDIPTTSGAGDIFFSQVIYYYLYFHKNIKAAIDYAVLNMKSHLFELNYKLFE